MATAEVFLKGGIGLAEEMRRRNAGLREPPWTLPRVRPSLRNHPLPRENLVRAIFPGPQIISIPSNGHGPEPAMESGAPTEFKNLRAISGNSSVMHGHFAVFDTWSEIDSAFEGRFMERFAPGAFKKTIRERRNSMRAIFQHGRDPQVGDKPLGVITELREDSVGVYYEVLLLEASYVSELVLPGLRSDLYGALFRFRVLREEIIDRPLPSKWNPERLPERTVKEVMVREFGPVTYPAYGQATAGVRSLTDHYADAKSFGDQLTERVRSPLRRPVTSTASIPRSIKAAPIRKAATASRWRLRPSWYL